jgi:hypothetical protein
MAKAKVVEEDEAAVELYYTIEKIVVINKSTGTVNVTIKQEGHPSPPPKPPGGGG